MGVKVKEGWREKRYRVKGDVEEVKEGQVKKAGGE